MSTKLSILIATMPIRSGMLQNLLAVLEPQCLNQPVEILTDNSMLYNIGVKRNMLLNRAQGEYVVFCDDDDLVSADYVQKILAATETNPDCIGMSGLISFNGREERQWHISKEFKYWYEQLGIYYRTPNHISPVRRELALQVMFPPISFGEDHEFSKNLWPLLKTEVVIPGNLYYYRYVQK